MGWATVANVLSQTGEEVTEANVALASSMIDTYSGADEEMPEDAITARDRKFLKKATCWQAPWVRDHPGLLTERESAKATAADGTSVQRESGSDIMLAPMAARELKNLSWVGTRAAVANVETNPPAGMDFLNERSDDSGVWKPV